MTHRCGYRPEQGGCHCPLCGQARRELERERSTEEAAGLAGGLMVRLRAPAAER
jgi:hypothetical protein